MIMLLSSLLSLKLSFELFELNNTNCTIRFKKIYFNHMLKMHMFRYLMEWNVKLEKCNDKIHTRSFIRSSYEIVYVLWSHLFLQKDLLNIWWKSNQVRWNILLLFYFLRANEQTLASSMFAPNSDYEQFNKYFIIFLKFKLVNSWNLNDLWLYYLYTNWTWLLCFYLL